MTEAHDLPVPLQRLILRNYNPDAETAEVGLLVEPLDLQPLTIGGPPIKLGGQSVRLKRVGRLGPKKYPRGTVVAVCSSNILAAVKEFPICPEEEYKFDCKAVQIKPPSRRVPPAGVL